MSKFHAHKAALVAVAAATAGTASAVLCTAGVAGASSSPDVTGKTFSQAQAALKTSGYTAVVQAVVGDKTAQGDCKVIHQVDVPSAITGWSTSNLSTNGVFVGADQPTLYPITLPYIPASGRVMLTLSCYGASDANPSHPTGSGDITTKHTK